MNNAVNRRQFIKYALLGVGAGIGIKTFPSLIERVSGAPVTQTIRLAITEAMVETIDRRLVYHWAFENIGVGAPGLPQMPGPIIEAKQGDTVILSVRNDLPDPHGFRIPGMQRAPLAPLLDLNLVRNGVTIPAGGTVTLRFVPKAGSYMYIDHLNAPVNRVLGLQGPMVVMPAELPLGSVNMPPYSDPTPAVQELFNDLGGAPLTSDLTRTAAGTPFPGDPWLHDDPHRSKIWFFNTIDPKFNLMAQNGQPIDPLDFKNRYLARYFTINGESGVYIGANHPDNPLTANRPPAYHIPHGNIGEPHLIRIMNAGMVTHSLHIHANHVYVLSITEDGMNNKVQDNVQFVDTWTARPGDRLDWLLPFIRCPDIPGPKNKHVRELAPQEMALVLGGVPQSPFGYPMHDHNEPSQTAAGGNYNQGVVIHFEITGDVDKVPFPVP